MDLAALEHGKPQRGVADRARHHHALAGLGAAAMNHLARRHAAERGDRDHQRARRRNRIAAEQRTAELRGILAERRRERLQPGLIGVAQRQRQHEAGRRSALGREIGQVHPQRLARDGVGRIVGQEMHALDDGVRRHHDVVAVGLQGRGVVVEPEGARVGRKRPEIARDQRVLAGRGRSR